MRASMASRSQQVFRTCGSSSLRPFTSTPQRPPPALSQPCQICSSSGSRSRISNSQTTGPPRSQRRWKSQTSPAATAASTQDPSTKNPPIPQTHYEFFPRTLSSGRPPKGPFHIDTRALRSEFLQLQAVAHPDLHPPHLKGRAEATSARINEAYKTLQDPLLRAQYLLGLRGVDVAGDEVAKVEDPELLMEVLDAREEIEAAREEAELDEMKVVNDERIEAAEKILERAFREDDIGAAKEEAVRLRYWVNIKESLDGWEKGKPVVLVH